MSELAKIPSHPLVELALQQGIALDPDKLMKLMDLQERHERNQAAAVFAEAIRQFQERCPPVVKGNPVRMKPAQGEKVGQVKYMFADYDDIMAVAQPLLTALGIVATFTSEPLAGMMKTTCRLRVGVHVEETTVTMPAPEILHANSTQQMGGALTYGKRYALVAALNIRVKGDDDDAATAAVLNEKAQAEIRDLLEQCSRAGRPESSFQSFWDFIHVEENTSKRIAEIPPTKFEMTKHDLLAWLKKYGGQK